MSIWKHGPRSDKEAERLQNKMASDAKRKGHKGLFTRDSTGTVQAIVKKKEVAKKMPKSSQRKFRDYLAFESQFGLKDKKK